MVAIKIDRFVFIGLLVAIVAATALFVAFKSRGEKIIVLGENCYAIPKERFFTSSLQQRIGGLPLDRTVNQVHLNFAADYIADRIFNYSERIDGSTSVVEANFTVLASALPPENVEYVESGVHAEELWLATGSYSEERLGRTVSWDDDVNLFRVYRANILNSWVFVDIDPREVSGSLPSGHHVVAYCHRTERMGRENFSCTRSALRGDLHIEYRVSEENFRAYLDIDEFVFNELESWRVGTAAESGCVPADS